MAFQSPRKIILTHNNADLDAIAALLAAHKLYPDYTPVLPPRLNRNAHEFVTLYASGLPFVAAHDFKVGKLEQVIVVDSQKVPDFVPADVPVLFIEHHALTRKLRPNETFTGEPIGAATTLLVERLREQRVTVSSLEATLLLLGIYEDTGSLTHGTTTPRDVLAAAWLLEQQAVLDTVRRFLVVLLTPEQQVLFERLMQNVETRILHGYSVMIASAQVEVYVSEVSGVAHRLRDIFDPAVLFVVAQLPGSVMLVCRTATEALDVGDLARLFGGGGHARAAAATIKNRTREQVVAALWEEAKRRIQPLTRVADLMSMGAHTVDADKTVRDVIGLIRRIGHEGYPVVEGGRVVGLLMRRDADRASEHNLEDLRVREVMAAGEVTLTPHDSVGALEQAMVASGWGQIPVVDDARRIIGIVTRTDLIKHWARVHPAPQPAQPMVARERIGAVLGASVRVLIDAVGALAQEQGVIVYLVGGMVRDLLLNRANFDIDFVVENDGIAFAEALRARYGGSLYSFRPFATSKWLMDEGVAAALGVPAGTLPEHVDFATARYEFYEYPTALPTVYSSSIKLDLLRRDFSINAMAVELGSGRLLDFYGGQADLTARIVRVLHSLSFVDDPTRILRAARFAHRLGFGIEERTRQLVDTALPMLRRITGERLKSELTLLLKEDAPEEALLDMDTRGVLSAIYPAFRLERRRVKRVFPLLRAQVQDVTARVEAYWHVLMSGVDFREVRPLCERLMFAHTVTDSVAQLARLAQEPGVLLDADARPSVLYERLHDLSDSALDTASLIIEDAAAQANLKRYRDKLRHVKPLSDGHTLRAMGLPPGPRYKPILQRLLVAWLDGDVQNVEDERALLERLVKGETL